MTPSSSKNDVKLSYVAKTAERRFTTGQLNNPQNTQHKDLEITTSATHENGEEIEYEGERYITAPDTGYKESKQEAKFRKIGDRELVKGGKLLGMHFPHTKIQYSHTDGDLIMMDKHQRAQLEYYLLNYDVNKLESVGEGATSIADIFRGGFKSNNFSVKKHGIAKVLKKVSLLLLAVILVSGVILITLSIIAIILMLIFAKNAAQDWISGLSKFLGYALCVAIFMAALFLIYNMVNAKMFDATSIA